MSDSPAFQFYPADYLADEKVSLFTLEAEGIYIRLMCYCWREGSIPADPDECVKLVGKAANRSVVQEVLKCFIPCRRKVSRLIHKRLNQERLKQELWRSKSTKGGIKSGQTRRCKLKGGSTKGQPESGVMVEPNGNSSSSSSSSSSNDISHASLEQVKLHASKIGLPDSEAEKFFHFYESKGWKVGKSPMRNWHSAMAGWKVRSQSAGITNGKVEDMMKDWH